MASKYETQDEEEAADGLIATITNLVLRPFRIIFSKPFRRAYLTSILAAFTALTLLGFAIAAYILFYWSYIPRSGFERTIYLQFNNVHQTAAASYRAPNHPHGTVSLTPDIVSQQKYDIAIELVLPRTPDNTQAGNFMLEAHMYAADDIVSGIVSTVQSGMDPASQEKNTQPLALATSRRPAMLPYRSMPVELVYKFFELPWYIINFRSEAESLRIVMFEGIEFPKGWRNVPSTMKVEVQSVSRMQVYSAKAVFRARFGGLRWVMYNHRVFSAVVCVGGFWMTEVLCAAVMWAGLSLWLAGGGGPGHDGWEEEKRGRRGQIKEEGEDGEDGRLVMSDTERTFPTTSGQHPLRYESPQVKQEEAEMPLASVLPEYTTRAGEADDEDDDEDLDYFVDSGLGTSMESSAGRRDSVRRRRGRASVKEEG